MKYILRFNRYYIFWEDYGTPHADKAAADLAKAQLKLEKPYWNLKIVRRETIIQETDLD